MHLPCPARSATSCFGGVVVVVFVFVFGQPLRIAARPGLDKKLPYPAFADAHLLYYLFLFLLRPLIQSPVTAMSLSSRQFTAIEITERVASSFSVLGSLFIIATYLASSNFHKPINRLIFYASWGNMIANVATLVARSGIRAGPDSALCQSQGFLIQM